ncbi:MAG: class I SAM-dependent methyltransferase [Acidimicrobiia bacterium]|nr:class I SAM-dependent methyltransferase [Acidimicrobiia bacterium]MDH5290402.1 class I SAM-dependent methyltransferase [Acidimicrobiia bacterium]
MSLHPELVQAMAGLPRAVRWHMAGRARSFPLQDLCAEVPVAGRVLEIGCGHALVAASLALQSTGRQVVGYDIDAGKIRAAEQVAAVVTAAGGHLAVGLGGSGGSPVPAGPWDAVVIADVLYLLAPADQEAILAAAAGELAPGGVLVLKELDDHPTPKVAFARAEELLATRVLRITAGSHLHWRSAADWAALLKRVGLSATVRRVHRGYPYPHVLIVGRRPSG